MAKVITIQDEKKSLKQSSDILQEKRCCKNNTFPKKRGYRGSL
jgi:hypothetical protein